MPKKPQIADVRAVATTPDPQWSFDKIRRAKNEHERGCFYTSGDLATWVVRDGRVANALQTRALGLTGCPFVVSPTRPGTKDTRTPKLKQRKAAERFAEIMPRVFPEPLVRELLTDVILMGFALVRLVWQDTPGDELRWVPLLERWDPKMCHYDPYQKQWFVQSLQGFLPISPGDGQWAIFATGQTSPFLFGAIRNISEQVLIRSFSWSDWAQMNGGLAQGFLKVFVPSWADNTTNPNGLDDAGTPDKGAFREAGVALVQPMRSTQPTTQSGISADAPLTSFASNVSAIQAGVRILWCEKDSKGDAFDAKYEVMPAGGFTSIAKAQERAEIEITTVILGQAGSVEVKQGQAAASTDQAKVRQDIIEGDAGMFAAALREQVGQYIALYNLGDPTLAPWAYYDTTLPEDKGARATTIKTLADALAPLMSAVSATDWELDIHAIFAQEGIPLRKREVATTPDPGADTPPTKKAKPTDKGQKGKEGEPNA